MEDLSYTLATRVTYEVVAVVRHFWAGKGKNRMSI